MGGILAKYPKNVTLRDGTEVILRPLKADDVEKLYEFFLSRVTENDLTLLKDNVKDYYVVEGWCKQIDYERVFPLVGETEEGHILGNATLHHRDFGWAKYVAKIRVVISYRCRGIGLGTAMIRELLEVAREMKVDKVMAEVLSSQNQAMETLENLGFQKMACIPELARDFKGERHDLCIFVYALNYE